MIKPAIHQFHSGSAFGDAVTNSLLYTKKILTDLGFESNIYVEHVAPELTDEILHFSKLKSNENNIMLLHHSIGHDLDEWVLSLKEKIVLVYHNITPEDFFPKESPFYHYSIKGREQLKLFKSLCIGAIGVSLLNIEELLSIGYSSSTTSTIPLLIDYDKIKNHPWTHSIFDTTSKEFNILFVGRIAENKGQLELLEMFKIFLELYDLPAKLYLVGGTSGDDYERKIREYISTHSLSQNVILTGKVSYEDLYAYYHSADAFVCLSEHEGFGVPLIEAMIFDVPVIAYNSSNIKNTLNGSGILFKEKNLEYMAGFVSILAKNRALRREIIKTQRDNLIKYQYQNIKYDLVEYLLKLSLIDFDITTINRLDELDRVSLQIEGPFDSSYSLALLNREMAKALNKIIPNKVALFSTEGGGDFNPSQNFLNMYPDYKSMYLKSEKASTSDVVLRNLYPPRVSDAKGLINGMNSYGWEESAFPQEYIEDFNTYLNVLPVMSKYVQRVMCNNGISIPCEVVGVGVDHILNVKEKDIQLKTKKKFKFLHISSCFPRKGIDILIEVYCNTFTCEDDVCLIIKTFPNPHNNVEELIVKYQNSKNSPEIELINEDLDDSYIVDLYKKSDCLVAPSRGEGFGLPMAEAMLFDLPVITTGFGGQIDFCTDETVWLIDYDFKRADTHMKLFNSYWAEPKKESLSKLMLEVRNQTKESLNKKTDYAKKNILTNHLWEHCATRLLSAIDKVEKKPIFEDTDFKLAWVSTWNTKCGIATYSKFLIDNLKKENVDISIFANNVNDEDIFDVSEEKEIQRVWNNASETDLCNLESAILEAKVNTLVIQFNFGFFNVYALENMIKNLQKHDIKIYITLHSVEDVNKDDFKASLGWIASTLQTISGLLVHNINDLNILKSFDLVDNVILFPHGVLKRESQQSKVLEIKKNLGINDKKVIASYGFLLPHKGIKELIEAFALVCKEKSDLHLLLVNALYPNPISDDYLKECNEAINNLELSEKITMINDFLSDDESFSYLDCADLLIMPYKETQESSSAAVRYAISTQKPILCTPINIFKDVEDIVHFCNNISIEALATSINTLLNNKSKLYEKTNIQKQWIEEHDWSRLSMRLLRMLKSKKAYNA